MNLKIQQPDSQIYYLCKEKYRPVVEMIDGVDRILTIPDNISAFKLFLYLTELDKLDFDRIIDLHGNLRSGIVKRLLTANEVHTYPKRRFARMLAVKKHIIPVTYPHTIDLYNQTVMENGGFCFLNRPLLKPDVAIDESVKSFIKKQNKFVVFAPGAAHDTKRYDVDKLAEAALMLYEEEKVGIVWAMTDENIEKSDILQKIPHAHFLSLLNCDIQQLTAIISKACLTVANDSGITHISSSVNTPVIALFGPTHPVLGFAPRGMFDQVIHVNEPCRPCSLHGQDACFREHRFCFDRIEPERIFNLAQYKLEHCRSEKKAVFVDRDGTIIVEKHFLSNPDKIEFIEGAVEALKQFQRHGFKIVIVSNQSGVARGKFGLQAVEEVNRRLNELLASRDVLIDAIYYCPHLRNGSVPEFSIDCLCRKPGPQMIEDAVYQLQINPRQSYVIGDKVDDINLGKVVGAQPILVRTGYGKKSQQIIDDSLFYRSVKVCDDLVAAEEWVNRMK